MSKCKSNFEKEHNLQERQEISNLLLLQYPGKIPVICEKMSGSPSIKSIKKTKYLIPEDWQFFQFYTIIRTRTEIDESEALFLLTSKGRAICGDIKMLDVYNLYKNEEDNILYLFYCKGELWG